MLDFEVIKSTLAGYLEAGLEVTSLAPLSQPDAHTRNYQGLGALDNVLAFEGRNVAVRLPQGFALKLTLNAWEPTFEDSAVYQSLVAYGTFSAFVGRTAFFDFQHGGRVRCVGDGRVRDGGRLHGVEVVSHGHLASGLIWSEQSLDTLQVLRVGNAVMELPDEIRDALLRAGALERA